MLRTSSQHNLERMAAAASVPIINGLSDTHHPCQTLADLQTIYQNFSKLEGLKLAYIGDGNNTLHSLMLLAPYLGIDVQYACPSGFEPDALVLRRAKKRAQSGGGKITAFTDPREAVSGAHVVYTDVWVSMGFEEQQATRERIFEGYQVNPALLERADRHAIVLHCLPMVRGKEITDAVADGPQSRLFQQSENRLHAQKALLAWSMGVPYRS
jgi:ornithine carbamoyltransferase